MAVVTLPPPLLRLFPAAPRQVVVEAASVAEAIDALDRRWPGMRDRLCDSTPRLRRHIAIYVGNERAALETRLPPDASLLVMTAITGG